jgi:hypothetical protein
MASFPDRIAATGTGLWPRWQLSRVCPVSNRTRVPRCASHSVLQRGDPLCGES